MMLMSAIVFTNQAQNAKKSYKNAKKFFESQQYQEAITELNQAIAVDASFIDAYVLRAQLLEKQENLDAAASDYEKASTLDPKTVDYLFQAGRLNYQIRNYTKAIQFLTSATTLDSKNFQALQYKAFTHIKLNEYKQAILALDNALQIEQTNMCFYARGVANDSLKNYSQAIIDYNKALALNPNFQKAYYALAKAYLSNNQLDNALELASRAVQKFPEVAEAYEVRYLVYYKRGELLNAINDLSKLETLTENKASVLFTRGAYYFEYEHFQNAKSDFSQVLALEPSNYLAIYWRGRSNEELMENAPALTDYKNFLILAQNGEGNFKEVAEAKKRLFELNRETIAPVVVIDTPMVIGQKKLAVFNNADRIIIQGIIKDQNSIESLFINGVKVELGKNGEFSYSLNITDLLVVNFSATDVYGNLSTVDYDLQKTEIDLPIIRITTPFASDNGEIYLSTNESNIFIEGDVEDASLIKDIFIDGVRASFDDTKVNPKFNATISIFNKNIISVKAVDEFNNIQEKSFTLNREGAQISQENPMGKTWVIFIENSTYETFASLEGPTKDVSSMKSVLANYQVHNFIHKKDMTKKEMERFFSIELRDQVKKNNVNSLLVWYAGHGKFINETGYWIPVDATRDDEFTYFNINSLKAGMQSYSSIITHTLVVTDACESGPSFYQAMRASNDIRSCDDVNATKFKSSQVFSSAGYELASDNSQFTKTFAKSLQFNEDACIPIESIVTKVTEAVAGNENQKPQFGKIAGFEDENGTFFFIKK